MKEKPYRPRDGACPVCGRHVRLDENQMLAEHKVRRPWSPRNHVCRGSGKPPEESR